MALEERDPRPRDYEREYDQRERNPRNVGCGGIARVTGSDECIQGVRWSSRVAPTGEQKIQLLYRRLLR